jgi:hypothetical protein
MRGTLSHCSQTMWSKVRHHCTLLKAASAQIARAPAAVGYLQPGYWSSCFLLL